MICNMSLPICNGFHARQGNSGVITTFYGIFLFDACVRRFIHKPSRLKLGLLKFTCASSFGLSLAISTQFTFKMFVAARNCEKFTIIHYFRVSRSFKVIDVDSPKKFVTSASYNKQYVCAYLQPFLR